MRPIFFAIALASTPAVAADLLSFGTAQNGSKMFVALDTLIRDEQFGEIWTTVDVTAKPEGKAVLIKQLWRYDCPKRSVITIMQVLYEQDGSVVSSRSFPDNHSDYERIVPGTFQEGVFTLVCSG